MHVGCSQNDGPLWGIDSITAPNTEGDRTLILGTSHVTPTGSNQPPVRLNPVSSKKKGISQIMGTLFGSL